MDRYQCTNWLIPTIGKTADNRPIISASVIVVRGMVSGIESALVSRVTSQVHVWLCSLLVEWRTQNCVVPTSSQVSLRTGTSSLVRGLIVIGTWSHHRHWYVVSSSLVRGLIIVIGTWSHHRHWYVVSSSLVRSHLAVIRFSRALMLCAL